MASTDRKVRQRRLTSESDDQTKSGNGPEEKSEEYKNFENFAKRLGGLTRNELDSILEKEKQEKHSNATKTGK